MGLHTSTISNWCAKGRIKGIKVKGSWKITRADLDKFKESRANGQMPSETKVVASPQTDRPELSAAVKRVHAKAEKMVYDRQKILAHLFPHPKPGEVYDYVLYNMAPKGLKEMPSLEEFIKMELEAEEQKNMTNEEPEEEYSGDLGARLAQAENEMAKLMMHSSPSVRELATLLHRRIEKITADNRKAIEDYAREQEKKR
jgi:hypothetical protein